MAAKIPTPLQYPRQKKRPAAKRQKSPGKMRKPPGANTVMARHMMDMMDHD